MIDVEEQAKFYNVMALKKAEQKGRQDVHADFMALSKLTAEITAERDALKASLALLQRDVLRAWRASRPKPVKK